MSKIINATDASFDNDVLKAKGPVLVDFWAAWCGPCRAVAPALEAIAEERAGKLTVVKIDVDQYQEKAKELMVRGIPAMFLFNDGKLVGTRSGSAPKDVLTAWIDQSLNTRPSGPCMPGPRP